MTRQYDNGFKHLIAELLISGHSAKKVSFAYNLNESIVDGVSMMPDRVRYIIKKPVNTFSKHDR